MLPPDDFLPASAVNRVFAEWEGIDAPILLAPEAATTAKREAAAGNASNIAWAGLMALMVGARLPARQAGQRSPRVAIKR